MKTVTSFNKTRADALDNSSVIDGNVVGNNLQLVTRGGTTIDLGSIRGNPGSSPGVGYFDIQTYTTATRPASPAVGTLIYDSDTKEILQYQSATTGWTEPWNMPWGEIGYAQATVVQGSIVGTVVDITGLSITKTLVANRIIETMVSTEMYSSVAADTGWLYIRDGANATKASLHRKLRTINITMERSYREVSVAGSMTRKVSAQRGSGTGNISVGNSSAVPWYIKMVDLGPAGLPV